MVNFIARILKWLWPVGLVLLATGFYLALKHKQFDDVSSTLSIVGLVLYLTIFVRGESANVKFYINVLVATVVMLAILVLLYLFASNSNLSWDVTKQKTNSLAPQTASVLKNLKTPVRLIAFTEQQTAPQIRDFLDRYANLSKQITVEMVDPVRDNMKAKKYKEQFDTEIHPGDLFALNEKQPAKAEDESASTAKAKPRFKRITPEGGENPSMESPITNGIIEVTQDKQLKVYVLQGPDYMTLTYSATEKGRSLSNLKKNLGDQAMLVEPLELRNGIPSDCSVLMAAGVHNDLYQTEADMIGKYLDGGGKLILYFDAPSEQSHALDKWTQLLSRYGIRPTENMVIDAAGAQYAGDWTAFIASDYDDTHPITKDMGEKGRLAVRFVRAIEHVDPAPQGYQVTDLVKSSSQSWSMPYAQLVQMTNMVLPSKDKIKPQPLAVAVSKSGDEKGTKIVAFGNSDLVSDNSNSQIVLNLTSLSLNWLAGNQERLAIPPRQIPDTLLFVSDSQMQFVLVLVVLAFPAALFFGGLSYTMLRRRSR